MPDLPSAEELSALPAAELAVRLAEAYRLIAELTEQAGRLTAQVERLSARVEELERQARKDSSTSSRPPSSDSPYRKKGSDRSLRERGKRRPGKQPGDPGSTMNLVDDPDEIIACPPAACCGCGADLASAPVTAQRRHQVTDIAPAPAPKVTEYVAQARECAGCGTVTAGELPAHVRARASYGPETCAQAANLVSGHHIPVHRATLLLCQLAGIAVSTGWMAGVRGKAAGLVEASGFMDRVRELLKAAAAVHADETPARAAGGTRYVHLACTRYLTCMHTGDRSAEAIDAGGVLPGYAGVIVRDGYAGYGHLTSAHERRRDPRAARDGHWCARRSQQYQLRCHAHLFVSAVWPVIVSCLKPAGGWCGKQHTDGAIGRAAAPAAARASGHPPDTYEEFLLMTRAPLPREPSAAARARGLTVG